jgi:hypothetical protein
LSEELVFGEETRLQLLPSQRSIKVCQIEPFRCRPTAQQSDAEAQVTPTRALTVDPLPEGTMVQLAGDGVEAKPEKASSAPMAQR